jgi:hypothetical protein
MQAHVLEQLIGFGFGLNHGPKLGQSLWRPKHVPSYGMEANGWYAVFGRVIRLVQRRFVFSLASLQDP